MTDPDEWAELVPSDLAAEFLPDSRDDEAGSLLATPLSVKGDVLGVMVTQDRVPHRFSQRRLELITGIAQQMALAVQNDRLQQERAERQRLERELQLALGDSNAKPTRFLHSGAGLGCRALFLFQRLQEPGTFLNGGLTGLNHLQDLHTFFRRRHTGPLD